MTAFQGLPDDIFSIYVPEKWSSNVYNLPRIRNKDLLLGLCDVVQQGLDKDLANLSRAASDEFPNIFNQKKVDAQWVYWFRDAAARASLSSFLEKTTLDLSTIFNIAPQDKHVALAVVLSKTGLWVGLWVAPGALVDRRNLSQKLSKSWEREHMLGLLAALPDTARMGFVDDLLPVSDITLEKLEGLSERCGLQQPGFQIGYHMPTEEVLELGHALVDELRRWLQSILPLYRFVAWTRDNDLIEASKQIQEEKAQKRRQVMSFQTGDKVRVIAGLFSGKQGIVQDIDTKGQVKVLVGKMSVVVPGADLLPVV